MLILPVDWFVGIARAVTNLIGNCVATVVVAVWEKDIDRVRAHRVLNQDADCFTCPPVKTADVAPVTAEPAQAVWQSANSTHIASGARLSWSMK